MDQNENNSATCTKEITKCTNDGITGLVNIGNTCYFNAIIQSLGSLPRLRMFFLSGVYKSNKMPHEKLSVADQFSNLLWKIYRGNFEYINPKSFINSINKYNADYVIGEQQDAREYLAYLENLLNEDLNTPANQKHLPEIVNVRNSESKIADREWEKHLLDNRTYLNMRMTGQFRSTLKCCYCDTKSVNYEQYTCLTLPVLTRECRLRDILRSFDEKELMTGDSKWDCPTCKKKRDATKQLEIWRLPIMLVIHFKRFSSDARILRKVNTMIHCPLIIDCSEFVRGTCLKPIYALKSVVNHIGTLDSGHYTCNCINGNKWFKFDDQFVYDLDEQDIIDQDAYMCFYSLV